MVKKNLKKQQREIESHYPKKLFDIVAFEVPNHKSLVYRKFLTKEKLLKALSKAIDLDANVISIRKVEKEI